MQYMHTLYSLHCRDKNVDTVKTLKEANKIEVLFAKHRLPL